MSHQSERWIDIYREKNLISVEFWTSLNDLIAKESITFKYGRITVFYIYKLEVITRITVDFLCTIGWYRIDHRKQISILNTAVFKVYKSSLHNQKFWENLEKLKKFKIPTLFLAEYISNWSNTEDILLSTYFWAKSHFDIL